MCYEIANASNNNPAVRASIVGLGHAGLFAIDHANSSADALQAQSNGSGQVVYGVALGSGLAARFELANAASRTSALYARTVGEGYALFAKST